MKNRIISLLLVSAILVIKPWGPEEYQLIRQIAYTQLNPAAKSKIDQAYQKKNTTFLELSSLPQELEASRLEYANDILQNNPASIDQMLTVCKDQILIDSLASSWVDKEGILFLSYLVADLHNPVAFRADAHPVKQKTGEKDLFVLWNTAFGQLSNTPVMIMTAKKQQSIIQEKARELMQKYPQDHFVQLDRGPVDWLVESRAMAKKHILPIPQGSKLEAVYVAEAKDICAQRMVIAGYRLAALLNEVSGNIADNETETVSSNNNNNNSSQATLAPVIDASIVSASTAALPAREEPADETPRRCGIM